MGDPYHWTVKGKKRRKRNAAAFLDVDVFTSPMTYIRKGTIKYLVGMHESLISITAFLITSCYTFFNHLINRELSLSNRQRKHTHSWANAVLSSKLLCICLTLSMQIIPLTRKSSVQKHPHREKEEEEGWLLALQDQRGPQPTITKILIVLQ